MRAECCCKAVSDGCIVLFVGFESNKFKKQFVSDRSSSSFCGELRSTSSVEFCAGEFEEITQQLWCGLTSSLALLLKTPGVKKAEAGSNGGRGAAVASLLLAREGAFGFGEWGLWCAFWSLELRSGLGC